MNDSPEFQFAKHTIEKLTGAGFQALLAGGCVRDYLLGLKPKDYDVATNATPEEVRDVFGKKKTIAIGEAFGVITVIGTKKTGNIEVATFRKDGDYSDGRRPESVIYCDAKEDALRRDFTINGLFFDIGSNEVVDYVEGQPDLEKKVIRAIGDAEERFSEDRLRMLRAVRFATTLNFEIDEHTSTAIKKLAPNIRQISSERIAAEMKKLLVHKNRACGLQLLVDTDLAEYVFSQWRGDRRRRDQGRRDQQSGYLGSDPSLKEIKQIASELQIDQMGVNWILPSVLVTLFWGRWTQEFPADAQDFITKQTFARQRLNENQLSLEEQRLLVETTSNALQPIEEWIQSQSKQWKLSNFEVKAMQSIHQSLPTLLLADLLSWSQLQPKLVQDSACAAIAILRSIARPFIGTGQMVATVEEKLTWPEEKRNPTPLLNGQDLMKLGVSKGPQFGQILQAIRQRQLDEPDFSQPEAIDWVKSVVDKSIELSD